ncbi:ATP-binding protein [Sphingosinicella soli]|uniref:histidine kinase n=1 Tax=Sphingosinicella soli TaxID=333708 RepID=A0A7W7B053_9SPHN|nr:nitrogen fixation/metabolism regulation signal transduction histidine kinase [Sphingosinicella soli]
MGLTVRLILLAVSSFAFIRLSVLSGYQASALFAFIVTSALIFEMIRFVSRTNFELTRFHEAARYEDYGERFELGRLGSGFGELGAALNGIFSQFQEARVAQERELSRYKALLEQVPVPLISLHSNRTLTLWNRAARRQFHGVAVKALSGLDPFGEDLCRQIEDIRPGERRLATIIVDSTRQRVTLAATQIVTREGSEKLISIQNIQSELDVAQLEAWQDLVRVLTHEIMNSITPISSLAQTAATLMRDVDAGSEKGSHEDIRNAVETIAARSEKLTKFVSNYRQLMHIPPPQVKSILAEDLFAQITALYAPQWAEETLDLRVEISPRNLRLAVDPALMEQVLINMLKNAQEATAEQRRPTVSLKAGLDNNGAAYIEVADNGTGIPADVAEKIFVPFYTTKPEGSGVGLALTRQVMIAHGGTISVAPRPGGGTKFTLGLPTKSAGKA